MAPFTVTGGTVFINSANINDISANKITAGTMSGARIQAGTLNANTISGGTISAEVSLSSPIITGGSISGVSINIGSGRFQVSSTGNVTITTNADITGKITATSGYIGTSGDGFEINSSYIRKGTKTSHGGAGTGVYIGTDGIGLGTAFTVSSAGALTATNASLTGTITSTAGAIGGWTIGASTLTGGNITLSSTGNIYAGQTGYDTGTGWYLANDGRFSVGNSAANKLLWDGSQLKVTGGIYITDTVGIRRTDNTGTLTITGGTGNAQGGQIDLVGNSGGANAGVVSLNAYGSGFIQFFTGGSQRGYVQPDGKFDWLGTAEFDGTVSIGASISLTASSGAISATSYNSTSSRRYKQNIKDFRNGLAMIQKLRPVTFDWNKKAIKNDIGFIAEEVYEVLPNIVHKNDKGEVESLDYSKIVPILIAAIKELSKELEEIKSTINQVKK